MKINIIGDIFGTTGYARHTRQLANALNDIGCDVRIESNLPQQWEVAVNDFELRAIQKPFDRECVSVMIGQPPFWRIALAQKPRKFFGFCVWEGDKIPKYWIDYMLDPRVDKILVPSQHTKDAIENTFAPPKGLIEIIPHGYDASKFYPDKKPIIDKVNKISDIKITENDIENTNFSFIANKGWSQGLYDRGGIQWLLKAFNEEFSKEDNVCLKIKINTVYKPNFNIDEECKALDLIKGKNSIMFVLDTIDDNALRQFYNEGDVFVSTSMADAFNIPCLEAMGCGVPVITTAFGGQSDFITPENGYLIRVGEFVNWSKEQSYEETKWFKPDIKEIRRLLRYAYLNQQEIKEKGKLALKDASKFTWLEAAKKLKALLD